VTREEIGRFATLTEQEFEQRVLATEYRHGDFLPELKFVYQSDRSTLDIALHLIEQRPTDVTAVGFYGVDVTSHLAWHFSQPERYPELGLTEEAIEKFGGVIDRYYEFVDEMLGRLLKGVGPETNVLVFSDHGFGPTGSELMPWSGGHGKLTPGAPIAPDGILILAGPSIERGVRLERPHVLDLAPMILHLQGLPVARDMPGGVFTEAFNDEFRAAVPIRQVATYEVGPRQRADGAPKVDPELDADMIQKLKALGYID
jgi:predicted AlkP superfamily phosphohydrolase/phosphomutase